MSTVPGSEVTSTPSHDIPVDFDLPSMVFTEKHLLTIIETGKPETSVPTTLLKDE